MLALLYRRTLPGECLPHAGSHAPLWPSLPPPCSADPALAAELGEPLAEALRFFGAAQEAFGPLLQGALAEATG